MKNFLHLIFPVCLVLFSLSCSNDQEEWPESTQEAKPWTRWWWPANAVDHGNIAKELTDFWEAGIGGVEITPIYGVQGEDDREITFLSPEFSEILNFTIDKANEIGMGVDLPPGSGWRCGGPFVPREKGLWNLKIEKQVMKRGDTRIFSGNGSEIAAVSFVDKSGTVTIPDKEKKFVAAVDGILYQALRVKSRDKVKRPAKGGEGWAIDTFDKNITEWYLEEFWKRLGVDEGKLRCFFHDSFEYTGDFTPGFLNEFMERRGYDLSQYLHVLAGDVEDKELVRRVKSDYRQTLADLVLDAFILPMTNWANNYKSLNRNQAHGSPGNILDLYAACDIPETEIFQKLNQHSPDIFVNKFASSAAHVTGQKLVSSESFTWLKEHWTVTTSDMVKATNRFFLSGVNHMFFHGTCYSPEEDPWPGWLFYASTQINDRNPLWRELPALFKYIERSQTILQKSTGVNDLLVYWPYFDVAAGDGRLFNHIGVNKDAGWFNSHPIAALSEKLQRNGFTFDYISDLQILNSSVTSQKIVTEGLAQYKAIVIPETRYMPLSTLKKLVQFMENGGNVYFESKLPFSVPGVYRLAEREKELTGILQSAEKDFRTGDVLELMQRDGITGEKELSGSGFYFLKMKYDEEDWYLVFNMGKERIDDWIKLNTQAETYLFYDPMSGEITRAGQNGNRIRLQLESEQIVFIRCTDLNKSVKSFRYEEDIPSVETGALWKVSFIEGGPVFPDNIQMDNLVSWTETGSQQTVMFSGTALYATDFQWDKSEEAVLDLGKVMDCARVTVNGRLAGTLTGPVFKVKLKNLAKGKNTLEIEITNVAANRIRDMDIKGDYWKKFKDINIVNLDYKPFDASEWEVRDAGLLGPVTLKPL